MTEALSSTHDPIETPFGTLMRRPEAELSLPMGLPGFAGVSKCLMAPVPGHPGPMQLLHGLDAEPFNLIVVPLDCLREQIDADEIEAVRANLAIPGDDLLVLCIVTLPRRGDGQQAQVNVRAPIFVDVGRRTAAQVVLSNGRYAFRAPLVAA